MFTGIIESIGVVSEVDRNSSGMQITVDSSCIASSNLSVGESIAVAGVCLTAVSVEGQSFVADVSNETIACSRFGEYEAGSRVNLEWPLTLQHRLGGHLVSGHVDGLANCVELAEDGENIKMVFDIDSELGRYVARKGSIAIDGVSLTINHVEDHSKRTRFSVNIIPHTLAVTTLSDLKVNEQVHVEVDLIARYAERNGYYTVHAN